MPIIIRAVGAVTHWWIGGLPVSKRFGMTFYSAINAEKSFVKVVGVARGATVILNIHVSRVVKGWYNAINWM
jgi:hypothetical protein